MSARLILILSVVSLMGLPVDLAAQDRDGDGHDAIEHGGDDCDDSDPNRFPGNTEIPDREAHDEDCDPTTFGFEDADGDGYGADWACNVDGGGKHYCGSDCDDSNASIHPTQIDVCNNRDDDCDGTRDEDQPCELLARFQEDPDLTMEGLERQKERSEAVRERGKEAVEEAYKNNEPAVNVGREITIQENPGSSTCHDAVQGEVAWNYQGATQWAAANVKRLCSGAERSVAPARCFDGVMHGGLEKPDGSTRWTWQETISLCEGTQDAKGTIACYRSRVKQGIASNAAIESCSGQF